MIEAFNPPIYFTYTRAAQKVMAHIFFSRELFIQNV